MSYSPPSGSVIPFEFAGAYTPPAGSALSYDFATTTGTQYVAPASFAGAFGTATVYNYAQTIAPSGLSQGVPGTPTVYNLTQLALPAGIAAGAAGTPIVDNWLKYVYFSGIAPGAFGSASVFNWRSYLTGVGGTDTSSYGAARVESTIRTIGAGTAGVGAVGEPTVWFRVRTLAPPPTFFTPSWSQFGAATVWDGLRFVYPAGLNAGAFGVLTIERNERFLFPAGITGSVPQPNVQLRRRYVVARDVPPLTEWGTATAFNSRQYLSQSYDAAFDTLDHGVGRPFMVENRNRVIGTVGNGMLRMSNGAEVANKARLLAPPGPDATLFGAAMVAYRIRSITAGGFDASYIEPWHALHNYSSVLGPSGIPRLHPGIPRVWDNTQHVDPAGGNDLTQFGVAFAAYRVRTVDVAPWGVKQGFFPDHDVHLYTRYMAPGGFTSNPGTPDVQIHFNILAPHGKDWSTFGDASVRNVTPEIRAGSSVNEGYGRPYVGLYTRTVYAAGISGFASGPQFIGPRTRTLGAFGFNTLRIPTHTVAFDAPQLPAQQTIIIPAWAPNPGSTEAAKYGLPEVRPNSIKVDGLDATLWGAADVHANSIYPAPIFYVNDALRFGRPSLNATQYVSPEWDDSLIPATPEPRISPTTIWISEPPPPLSRKPKSIVDEVYSSTYPSWGTPVVTHYTRYLAQWHDEHSQVVGEKPGDHEVSLRVRRVAPVGIQAKRVGVPNVKFDRVITPYWGRSSPPPAPGVYFDTAAYGEATVTAPVVYDPYLHAGGDDLTVFGTTQIELFNRTISPSSWYSNIFTGDNWVHPPIVLHAQGKEALSFGSHRISHFLQVVAPPGYSPSQFEFDSGGTFGVTRVRERRVIKPLGFTDAGSSLPTLTLPDLGIVVAMGDTLVVGHHKVGECAC